MNAFVTHLLANCSILLFGILAWTNLPERQVRSRFSASMEFGIVFGICAVAVMMHPFEVRHGAYIDLRTVPISIAGLVGGWPSALIAAGMAATVRFWFGGSGMTTGISLIALTAGIGALASMWVDRKSTSYRGLVSFSALVALGNVGTMLVLTGRAADEKTHDIVLVLLAILFLATVFSLMAVFAELRRRDANRSMKMYEAAIQSLPESLNVKDTDGRFVIANAATAKLMHRDSVSDLIGKTDHDFYPVEIADKFRQEEVDVMETHQAAIHEDEFTHLDGRQIALSSLKAPLNGDDGTLIGVITHNRDLTDKKRLLRALAESEKRAQAALSTMADGLIMFDSELNVIFCNEQYRAMFPLTADVRVPGVPARKILQIAIERGEFVGISPEKIEGFIDGAMSRLRQPGVVEFPLFDGRWVESRTTPSADGGCLVVCSDITRAKLDEQELRALNGRLSEMAMTDSLTELLNRRAFDASLASETSQCLASGSSLSLLLIDVDHFKAFNDTYGHAAGDECLKAVAQAVKSVAKRSGDRAARYGGEEMAVILPNVVEDSALAIAHQLRKRVRALAVTHVGSDKGTVTVSIGVATMDGKSSGLSPSQLVKRADEALYRAKASGRDTVRGWETAKNSVQTEAGAPVAASKRVGL